MEKKQENYSLLQQAPILVGLGFMLFLIIRVLFVFLQLPDLAGMEQNVIYSTQHLINNGNLYPSPQNAPFSITQYTPFYYYLSGMIEWLFRAGKQPDVKSLYMIGRGLSLFFNVVSAIFVFKIARNLLSIPKERALFASFVYFALLYSHNFAVRPDSMCDMFGIISVYYFLAYQLKPIKKGNNFLLFWVVLLTSFSVFSKQSGIQWIIIFFGFSLWMKQWATLLKMSMMAVLVYAMFLVFFKNIYPYFFDNIIIGIANGLDIKKYFEGIFFRALFIISSWLLIIVSIGAILKRNEIFKGEFSDCFLAIVVLGTFSFATLTALKLGSTPQYYTLFETFSLIYLLKIFGDKKDSQKSGVSIGWKNSLAMIMAYFTLASAIYFLYDAKSYWGYKKGPIVLERKTASEKVIKYIHEDMGNDSLKYIFANLATHNIIPDREGINNSFYKNCLVPQLDIMVYSTGPSKILGYSNLDMMIRKGKVVYIIESEPRFGFKLLNNLDSLEKANYKLVQNFDGYLIYKLKNPE